MPDVTPFASAATPPEQVTPPVVTPTTPVIPQELADIVGAGKKYSTVEEALKSVPHAQKHIVSLETELAQIKAELEKRKTTEELLNEIKTAGTSQVSTNTSTGVTPETVTQLVAQTIKQREIQKEEEANTNKVISVFKTKFGEHAEATYIKIAEESGISIKSLNLLAATSPSAVFKLAGLDEKTTMNTGIQKPTSSVNTQALDNNTNNDNLSSRVGKNTSTKNLLTAWKIAGQKVGKEVQN